MQDPDSTARTPWLRRDQWELFRSVFAGDDELPASYDEWLHQSQGSVIRMTAAGFRVKRIEIDVEELVAWCRRNRRPVDVLAMMLFSCEVERRESPPLDRQAPSAATAMRRIERRVRVGGSSLRISVYTPDDSN